MLDNIMKKINIAVLGLCVTGYVFAAHIPTVKDEINLIIPEQITQVPGKQTVSSDLKEHGGTPERTYDFYYEKWAAVPIERCSTTKQKVECLKARELVKSYPKERQQAVRDKLIANEQKAAKEVEIPALRNPNAPITARDIAILKIMAKKPHNKKTDRKVS